MAKRSWFSSVKKALSLHSKVKGKEGKRANKSRKKWFGKERQSVSASPYPEPFEVSNPHPLPQLENKKLKQLEKERRRHAKAAAKSARRTKLPQYAGEPHEAAAAIRIQTAFRGYLGRRALRGLRGLVRLKSLMDGPTAQRQTTNTLKTMQTLSRLQSQIQSSRMRKLDENRPLQREVLQKRAKELDTLRMAEEWDDSPQSKEEVEASLLHKHQGAIRRERALAYSYTHQQTWKKSKLTNILFTDPTNPHWGWSWLERWIDSTPPLETKKDEITKCIARHHLNSDNHTLPAGKKPPPKAVPVAARMLKQANQRVSQDDESRSVQSERIRRRHSIAGSSDHSLESSPPVPSYMTPTRSAKAKKKLQSHLGMESTGVPGRESGFAKKRLSFPH